MIDTFRNNGLRDFHIRRNARRLPVQNTRRVALILAALEAASVPGDMMIPGFRFHPLGLMDPGRYAVTVSGNYRITFAWGPNGAVDVDIEDYH